MVSGDVGQMECPRCSRELRLDSVVSHNHKGEDKVMARYKCPGCKLAIYKKHTGD